MSFFPQKTFSNILPYYVHIPWTLQAVVVSIKLGKNCLIYGYIPIIERISMGSKFLCDVFSHISTFITTLYLIATCPIFHNWTMHYICNSTRTESQTAQCANFWINRYFSLLSYLIKISYSLGGEILFHCEFLEY